MDEKVIIILYCLVCFCSRLVRLKQMYAAFVLAQDK